MSRAAIELFHWLYGILLKSHIDHINIINSCCLTSLILKKVWSDDASCPKSTPNNCGCIYFSLITRGFSELQTRQFWRLTKLSRWKRASSIILIEKSASTFWWLIIIKTRCCISAVKLFFFQSCQQL